MLKKLILAAAIGVASTQFAFAQSVDPSGANRGYPVDATPGQHWYMGQLQGGPAPSTPGVASRPAALRHVGRHRSGRAHRH